MFITVQLKILERTADTHTHTSICFISTHTRTQMTENIYKHKPGSNTNEKKTEEEN